MFLILDDPTEPDLTLHPPSFLVSVEYNPKDPNILAGGCYNGQVSDDLGLVVYYCFSCLLMTEKDFKIMILIMFFENTDLLVGQQKRWSP